MDETQLERPLHDVTHFRNSILVFVEVCENEMLAWWVYLECNTNMWPAYSRSDLQLPA